MNELFLKLKEIQKNAYVPYSNFKVASICKSGDQYFYGVNIENSSYPAGNCAERSAICAAISKGCKTIDEVYVLTDSKDIGTPCGVCRQFMSEFMDDNSKIIVFNINGESKTYTMSSLLVDRFSKKELTNK